MQKYAQKACHLVAAKRIRQAVEARRSYVKAALTGGGRRKGAVADCCCHLTLSVRRAWTWGSSCRASLHCCSQDACH